MSFDSCESLLSDRLFTLFIGILALDFIDITFNVEFSVLQLARNSLFDVEKVHCITGSHVAAFAFSSSPVNTRYDQDIAATNTRHVRRLYENVSGRLCFDDRSFCHRALARTSSF